MKTRNKSRKERTGYIYERLIG